MAGLIARAMVNLTPVFVADGRNIFTKVQSKARSSLFVVGSGDVEEGNRLPFFQQ
jgi:hypothetical protein